MSYYNEICDLNKTRLRLNPWKDLFRSASYEVDDLREQLTALRAENADLLYRFKEYSATMESQRTALREALEETVSAMRPYVVKLHPKLRYTEWGEPTKFLEGVLAKASKALARTGGAGT